MSGSCLISYEIWVLLNSSLPVSLWEALEILKYVSCSPFIKKIVDFLCILDKFDVENVDFFFF